MRFIIAGLLTLLALAATPTVASAQEAWRRGPSTSSDLCSRGVGPGDTCYWAFNNDATDSPVLTITAEYATVCYDPDIAAATTTTATVEVMQIIGAACSGASASANTAEPINNGTVTTLTGDSTASADCVYEVPLGCIWINPTGSVAASDAVVKVTGSPGFRQ